MKYVFSTLVLCLLVVPVWSQGDDEPEMPKGGGDKKKEKTYEKVLEGASTSEGLFTVHQKDGKTYFELTPELLDREILVVSRIAGHVKGLNFGGAGMKSRPQQVIRWQRMGNRVMLRSVSYSNVANPDDPVYESVRNNNFEPVIHTFKIEVWKKDSSALVFDATSLFTTDIPMIGALRDSERQRFKVKGLDKNRSMITSVKAFPQNVEVRHILTYRGDELPSNGLTKSLSLEMNQSFIILPETPMQPRYYDERVSYFSIRQTDYSLDAQKAKQKRFITRWRLEPSDMDAWKRGELVEPKKPIVYYVDPGTPEKWRPYLKQGVEDWNKAFAAAGFKNAILAKDPPSKEEDPNWSPEDVRYSVIRYITTDIQNAQGPHVHDPRTGEILESDILWYHNVMNLLRNWFFIQTSAVNPDARSAKFQDELMGELIRFVAAHEVGHTLGFPHNMGSSSAYPVDSLRKAGFVQRMGTAPSIMDYARFNYVAQPEDKGAGLMPAVGPYDLWSTEYGYRPIPEASSAEAERAILHEWITERADDPIYRFGQRTGYDPTAQTEDLGDDSMEASELGLANLKRIIPNLIEWSTTDGLPYDELEELYGQVLGQLRRYAGHVSTNVGGVYQHLKTADEDGVVFTPVEKEKQARAVDFLNQHLFETPEWMLDKAILQRVEASGALERVRGLQVRTLRSLFSTSRLHRMIENEALNGTDAYSLMNLMDDTREGVFAELYRPAPIDAFRRNLQRAYVAMLAEMLNSDDDDIAQTDIRALSRATLLQLQEDIQNNQSRQPDTVSKAHLMDLEASIERAFEAPVLK